MQRKVVIDTINNKKIYGVLDAIDGSAKKLIIFVHGFTGNKDQVHYYNAVPYFQKFGVATFRFNFYDKEIDARKTSEISFQDHMTDLNCIIKYFEEEFQEIYIIGDSLGASIASFAKQSKIHKFIFWEPSVGFRSLEEKGFIYIKELNAYLCNYRLQSVFSKDFIESWMEITIDTVLSKLKVPTKIIFAENYNKYEEWQSYLTKAPINGNFDLIENASHNFTESGSLVKLYKSTYDWIK